MFKEEKFEEEEIPCVGRFLTLIARDRLVDRFGAGTRDWPEHNWWQLVSTERLNITKEELPGLMIQYKVATLVDYERYFGAIPQEIKHEV